MLAEIIKIVFRFIILVAIQVLVLNNIRLGGYINPYIYVLFILLLPVRIPKTLLLVLAFALGLCVDIFSNTLGMHAAATVFLAFCRPGILRALAPRDGYEAESSPSMREISISWFLLYTLIMVFIHHLALFYLEVFRFNEFFSTFLRALVSTLFTVAIIMLSQFLFTKPKTER